MFYTLPVGKKDKDRLLLFAYKSGKVNEVALSTFKKGVNLNEVKKDGFRPDEMPMTIGLVNQGDLMVIYNADVHGHEYVKVHRVSDINPTQSGKNQGSGIVPNRNAVRAFQLVSGNHADSLAAIMSEKAKTTRDADVPVTTVDKEAVAAIEYLKRIE